MNPATPFPMSGAAAPGPELTLSTYFRAKDGNRPHLIDAVFTPDAILEMQVNTDSISFPALTRGRAAIAEVLVSRFARTYENVYSFCLARPRGRVARFSCDWLVAMSAKDGGAVRVGCGRYDWRFQDESPYLATRLVIAIEAMQVLAADQLAATLGWVMQLSYAWSSPCEVLAAAPDDPALASVIGYIGRLRPGE